jgi:hypothetical protein
MICTRCNIDKGSVIFFKGKWICGDCYLKKTPPKLMLVKHWSNTSLFDPNRKSYLKMDIDFLVGCGFKVFRHCTFSNKLVSPLYKEYITLRYFGDLSCPLITNYDWPKFQPYCRSLHCRSV